MYSQKNAFSKIKTIESPSNEQLNKKVSQHQIHQIPPTANGVPRMGFGVIPLPQKKQVDVASRTGNVSTSNAQTSAEKPLSLFKQQQLQRQQAKTHSVSVPRPATARKSVPRQNDVLGRLMEWCKVNTVKYGLNITNFTTCFKNGMAFCALIHNRHPNFFDYGKLKPENAEYNLNLAFDTAYTRLGVPKLLEAEDVLCLAIPDKQSMVTYLMGLYNALR